MNSSEQCSNAYNLSFSFSPPSQLILQLWYTISWTFLSLSLFINLFSYTSIPPAFLIKTSSAAHFVTLVCISFDPLHYPPRHCHHALDRRVCLLFSFILMSEQCYSVQPPRPLGCLSSTLPFSFRPNCLHFQHGIMLELGHLHCRWQLPCVRSFLEEDSKWLSRGTEENIITEEKNEWKLFL